MFRLLNPLGSLNQPLSGGFALYTNQVQKMNSETQNADEQAKKLSFKRLLPLLVVLFATVAAFAFGIDDYLSLEMLRDHRDTVMTWYSQNTILATVSYMLVYAVVVALSLPGAVWVTLVGGFLLGTVKATIIVVIAATLGALAIFLIARYALADFFHAKLGDRGHKMEDGFRENALSYLLVLRLVPLFPFWLVNLVPALFGVPVRTYLIGTFLGIIPGTAVFCSVGNGLAMVFEQGGTPDLSIIFSLPILGPLLGLSMLSLLPVFYKKYKTSQAKTS